jgi:hypothetical protein
MQPDKISLSFSYFFDRRWPFAELFPEACTVNHLTVDIQPIANAQQNVHVGGIMASGRGPIFNNKAPFVLTISTGSPTMLPTDSLRGIDNISIF